MAPGQEPLLANRPSSQNSREREEGLEEEDALLTGQRTGKQQASATAEKTRRWREIGLFVWALAATAVVVVLAVVWQHNQQTGGGSGGGSGDGKDDKGFGGKKNLIFMVSDGMGPTSLSLTRSWRQYTEQLPFDETLILDEHLIGQSRTRSSSSLVTDSAAGATAFSCGQKSYNGAISVLPNFDPCGSVMEAAKRMGYTTGLVVTTRITDATPAVFASHVRRREMEDEIALQMIGETHPLGRMVDLMMGGGRAHFLPNTTNGGSRTDGKDLTKLAAEKHDWNYIDNKKSFDNLGTSAELPLLALFAPGDIPYEIDRRNETHIYPSLEQMTRTALSALSAATKNKDKGFFVMIEGSRIDHAGHANDPAAQVHEVLAYDRAMSAVFDFIQDSETPTLMVSTSDHETGGLATARQLHQSYPDYLWYPGVLANVTHSASHTAREYNYHLQSLAKERADSVGANGENLNGYLKMLLKNSLGIHDPTLDEMEALVTKPERSAYTFADMVSRRAQTGWSTHGHSGADVNIYTSDPAAASALRGNHENTEVGEFLRSYLGLDDEVEKVSEKLRKHMKTVEGGQEFWLGSIPEADERLDGQDHLDHYHGDHKTKRCEVCGI
ncbi:related to alkaline phosphatase Pho8 [Lecanosticta acicola]|uniref:Alkaline phosphatase n=1 Tax=Lecanosticta acicola TaxID=111012 RepID=A0AAI8YWC4_9PEZI|nr:related to alkaline phosphatase Pho8 [Lecanosticta acicola]